MNFLQLLPKRKGKIFKFCDFLVVILILFQDNYNSVNCSRSQDSNLYNDDYVSEIIRRFKRQPGIGCEIPNYGLHARYTILGETTTTYQPGDYAQQYYTLEVSCDRGYNLKPIWDKRTVCIDGQWNPPLTIHCIRTCPSLKSTTSTSVKCKYHNIPLENCNNPVEETTAYLSCNPLYEQDNPHTNRIRLCRSGRWIPSISECYPICGAKRPKGRLNIVNGQNATLGDYPWQTGIYNARKELICGGSIIDRHIILTAAHCLTDHNGNVKPTEDYLIAAGKYYREYDDVKDVYAQYSKVQSIYVPDRYTGISNNFAQDIAIILLSDPFMITVGVQPVCIELNEDFPYLHLSLHSNGIVTGWGYTVEGRKLSEVLKELVIPFIPFRKCFEEVPEKFKKFVTADKICGGYLNSETSVCEGDSGGALVFQHTYTERYYVKGIVSISPATEELTCDSNQYSLYTSVEDHVEFIMNILAYNQIQQSIEVTNEDSGTGHSTGYGTGYSTGHGTGYGTGDTCSIDHYITEILNQASSTPPQIIPKVAEFTTSTSSNFELRCLSRNIVTWIIPNNLGEIFSNQSLTKYSTITIKSSQCNSVHESLLTIYNVSYLDVGFYYCKENTAADITDPTKTSRIYIYVHDDQKLFLMPEYRKMTVIQFAGSILPCRPTAPDVDVKLFLNSGFEVSPNSKDHNYVTYDPKIGFIYATNQGTIHFHPSDNYTCSFSRGPYTQLAVIDVYVESIQKCYLDSDRGRCRDTNYPVYYDRRDGTCKQFLYGGCGGNENKFETFPECYESCAALHDPCSLPPAVKEDIVILELEQWYFNKASGSCETFKYGGAEGNDNKFDDQISCEKRCKHRKPESTTFSVSNTTFL